MSKLRSGHATPAAVVVVKLEETAVRLQPVTVEHDVLVEQEEEEAVVAGQNTSVVQSVTVCVEQPLIKSVKIRIFNHLN